MAEVKVGYLPMVSSLPMFVATEKGFFTNNNIKILPSVVESSNGLARELQKGSIDLAVELSVVPLLQNKGSESPYFKIFSISKIKPIDGFEGILVKDSSTIKSFEELSGKRIATFTGSTSPKSIEELFSRLYPNKNTPDFITGIRLGDQLPSLIRGTVDAVHAYEPMYTVGVVQFKMRDVSGSIYGKQTYPYENPIGVAALNNQFITNYPETAKNVVKAIDQAVIYIRENEDESRRILAKYTKLDKVDRAIAARMRILPMSTSSELDTTNLQRYLDFLRKIDESKSSLKANQIVYKPLHQ